MKVAFCTFAAAAAISGQALAQDVPEFGLDATRQLTVVGTAADGLNKPTGLAFNPDMPTQLWAVNYQFNGTVMFNSPGTDAQTADKRIDSFGGHFMVAPTAIAFGDKTFRGGQTFATCQDSRNGGHGNHGGNDFMGPTLWPADLAIYARVNQGGPLLGSHIDMLHQSPLCMGITHDDENVFWVTDGKNGHIVRYDFSMDHGPGHDDHADGIVRRYPEATFTRVAGVPGHVLLDKASGWLYVADTGAGRVYRLNTRTGSKIRNLPQRNEPLEEFSEWKGATIEVLLTGLDKPSGLALNEGRLFVGLYGSNEIVAYDIGTNAEMQRIATDAQGLSGLTMSPDGHLWYADLVGNKVVRVDP